MAETEAEARARYARAAHAMQTGVEYYKAVDGAQCEPKHLRVGVNSAMAEAAGLATLLIEKGVFTMAEYASAMADAMEREAASYRKLLADHYQADVTLA